MTESDAARRRARRRVCALFDDAVDEGTARGRRDAALVSILLGAGVPRTTALALSPEAYDPETGILAWPRGPGARPRIRRRAVEGAREALGRWRSVRGEVPGALLCRLDDGGTPTGEPLDPAAVDRILEDRARRAGVRAGSVDALRRLYDSPWWEEVSRSAPGG
mgnify:CR=1 FL=1